MAGCFNKSHTHKWKGQSQKGDFFQAVPNMSDTKYGLIAVWILWHQDSSTGCDRPAVIQVKSQVQFHVTVLVWSQMAASERGKNSSHAQQTFPGCVKVTSTSAAVHPTPPPQPRLATAKSSCHFHVPDWCCCCFLLWAQFYTVCQSPERHTLEGPVEWDTKSDPSGEKKLFSHLLPLALFVSLYLPPFLPLNHFFKLFVSFILSLSTSLPSAPANPQTPGRVWASQIPSVWKCYATSAGALSVRVVGQAQPTSPSMHHSECATNEHDWRNAPAFFVW